MILRRNIVRLLPLFFLLTFSSLQYALLLRHKNPYTSDSYFYLHQTFEFLGAGYEEAHQKILEVVDLHNADAITINIFSNSNVYRTAHFFFTKRLFYPFLVSLLMRFGLPQDVSMMIPIFLSFIGILVSISAYAQRLLHPMHAFLTVILFVAFSPTLEWATYFMTDMTSGFFWMGQLFMIDRYLHIPSRNHAGSFALLLIIALLNREQHLLIVPQLTVLLLLCIRHSQSPRIRRRVVTLLIVSVVISVAFLSGWQLLNQSTLLENLSYLHNSYGLQERAYTPMELLTRQIEAIGLAHRAFVTDLVHHRWWTVMVVLGLFEMVRSALKKNVSRSLPSDLLLASAIASYGAIFFFPVLSYRFFFPVVIAIIIFGFRLADRFFRIHIAP